MARMIVGLIAVILTGACGMAGETTPPAATSALALVGGRVHPSPDSAVIPDGVVLVTAGRITAVGRRADVAVPPGATVIDCAGATVLAASVTSGKRAGRM